MSYVRYKVQQKYWKGVPIDPPVFEMSDERFDYSRFESLLYCEMNNCFTTSPKNAGGKYRVNYIKDSEIVIERNYKSNGINCIPQKLISTRMMFYQSGANLDLTGLDVSEVTDMGRTFYMSGTNTVDATGWDTSSVLDMSEMFDESSVVTVIGAETWDTSNVKDMSYMFFMSNVKNINIENWDTSSVTNMAGMFYNFNKESLSDSLDLSHWDVSNVTNMYRMFNGTSFETLDLSGWDISKVTNTSDMFRYNNRLRTIYARGWSETNINYLRNILTQSGKGTQVTIITE